MQGPEPPITNLNVRFYVDDMKRIHKRFPFGKNVASQIIGKFDDIYGEVEAQVRLSKGYKPAVRQSFAIFCKTVYTSFTEWSQLPLIFWVQNHEKIRGQMIRFLSKPMPKAQGQRQGFERFVVQSDEFDQWRREVHRAIKKLFYSSKDLDKISQTGQHQICIDTMHSLVKISVDREEDYIFKEQCTFLIGLLQRTSMTPSEFVLKDVVIDYRHSVDSGASAVVFRGQFHGQEVAVKRFRIYIRTVERCKKRFLKEALILNFLRHPNILLFLGTIHENMNLCIVSPWLRNGDIMQYIRKNPDTRRKELLEQASDGLDFMHKNHVVHGDLKGANVLIKDDGKACIADFRLSGIQQVSDEQNHVAYPDRATIDKLMLRFGRSSHTSAETKSLRSTLNSALSTRSGAGTVNWMAPERLVPKDYNRASAAATFSSDVFSFAMLVLEVYSGAIPYPTENACDVALNIVGGVRPHRPQNIPDAIWSIAVDCWGPNPTERPSAWNIYNRFASIE